MKSKYIKISTRDLLQPSQNPRAEKWEYSNNNIYSPFPAIHQKGQLPIKDGS